MDGIRTILDIPGGGIAADRLAVSWHDRLPVPSQAALSRIEERWAHYAAEAQQTGKALFNGGITRFLGAAWAGETLRLELAETDYKTFLVTCMRDHAWFQAHAPEAIACGLGNSVLLTHGDEALLGIRSSLVSAYANRVHVIGGVLEALAMAEYPATWQGIVAHLAAELREELGVTLAELSGGPRLLAIVHEKFLEQPEMIWRWETAVPLEQIATRPDQREHSEIVILERSAAASGEMAARMTPVARVAMREWQREGMA